jgi:hypothetical protein
MTTNKSKEGKTSSPRWEASGRLLGGGEAGGKEIITNRLRRLSGFELRLRGASEKEWRRLVWEEQGLRLAFYRV